MPLARNCIIAIILAIPATLLLSLDGYAVFTTDGIFTNNLTTGGFMPATAGTTGLASLPATNDSTEVSASSAVSDTTDSSEFPDTTGVTDPTEIPDTSGVTDPTEIPDTIGVTDPTEIPDTTGGLPSSTDPEMTPDAPSDPLSSPAEAGQEESGQSEVHFSSSDSLVFTTRDERKATLYGNASVGNESGELTAGEVLLNLDQNRVSARAAEPEDTLSQPVLQRGQDQIRSERIQYNYETEKGKFDVARLSMSQGNVIGTQVKRTDPHVVFVEDGIYSTCDLDHPHFYIRAKRMKVVDEEEVFFTRARLFILDIPYPMIFPFGYVPSGIEQRQSGLLEPTLTYQNQQQRGIGVQNLGWFQYFNDYLTGQIDTDIFTSGTYYVNTRMNYQRTDRYSGSIELSYSRDQGMEPTDPDFSANKQRRLGFNHRQTLTPYSSLSANINLRTQDFYRRNSYDIDDRAEVNTSSRASYNYSHPENAYSLNLSARHSQNFATNVTSLTGPDINFSMRRLTPFQQSGAGSGESWYESISIQYRSNFKSRYDYRPHDVDSLETDIGFMEALFSPSKHREATGDFRHIQTGAAHDISANAQLFSNAYANLTSSVSMNEYWYPKTLRKEWDEEQETVVESMETGFATARDFNTSVSANTTIYGMSETRIGRFEGFRHTMRPSLSFSYRPDFSDPMWGVYRDVQVNAEGDTQTYSKFEGGIVRGPGSGLQQTMSLSISNNLETKEVRRDSTGERSERTIRLIDRLNLSTSYNFAAESYNLSDLSASMSSSFFQNLRLNANASFSFYDTDEEGNRIDRYLWEESGQFMRLTRFTFSTSTQFSGGGSGRGWQAQWHYPEHYDPLDQSRFHPVDRAINEGRVQPIDVPWSMSVNFNYSWNRQRGGEVRQRAIVNAQSIQIRLTPEWQMSTSLGYDFIDGDLTPSRFSITRNLHCWNMSFQWNPFDDFKFFMFRLTVADSQLQGLFQKLPGLNNLEKSSGTINRRF